VLEIAELPLSGGLIGLSRAPGRYGDYAGDMTTLLDWQPDMVLTMTSEIELEAIGADTIAKDLAAALVLWRHFPVTDFRAPCASALAEWPSAECRSRRTSRSVPRCARHRSWRSSGGSRRSCRPLRLRQR
jgi:hypothetical protein